MATDDINQLPIMTDERAVGIVRREDTFSRLCAARPLDAGGPLTDCPGGTVAK